MRCDRVGVHLRKVDLPRGGLSLESSDFPSLQPPMPASFRWRFAVPPRPPIRRRAAFLSFADLPTVLPFLFTSEIRLCLPHPLQGRVEYAPDGPHSVTPSRPKFRLPLQLSRLCVYALVFVLVLDASAVLGCSEQGRACLSPVSFRSHAPTYLPHSDGEQRCPTVIDGPFHSLRAFRYLFRS